MNWSSEMQKWLEDNGEHIGSDQNTTESNKQNTTESNKPRNNMVDHPRHYNRDGAIECIDEMELIYGREALMHFCLLSAHKYRYRAGLKDNGYQDLEKSDWYMAKYKELKQRTERKSTCSINI